VFHVPFALLGAVRKIAGGRRAAKSRTELRGQGELPKDPFIPDHYIEWLPLAYWKILADKHHKDIDLIYASGPPFSVHLLGYLLKAKLKKPLVLEYRDVLTDDPYNKSFEIKEKANRFLEKLFVKNADAIVSVSQPIIDQVLEKHGLQNLKAKCFEIPSAFDPKDFQRVDATLPASNQFVISLTTTLYGARRPDILFSTLSKLKSDGVFDGIEFLLNIYGYNDVDRFQGQLEKLGIQDIVQFKGFIPHADCLAILKGSTFNLDLGEQDFDYPTLPFHYWEYLGTGTKVLHFGFSNHYKAKFTAGNGIGIILPIEDPARIYDILAGFVREFKEGTLDTKLDPEVVAAQTWVSRVGLLAKIIRAIEHNKKNR
jgi:glycosyltransferase involved in cell wall biosynthesis